MLRWAIFLTLLTSLACTMAIPNSPNALPTQNKPIPNSPNALGKLPTASPTPETALVIASQSLNVRERAGWQQIRVLGVLSHGDRVELTGTCAGVWAEIVWDAPRGTAWVNSKYLSENICSEEQ